MNIQPSTFELQKCLQQPGRRGISEEPWENVLHGRWIIAILKHITKLRSTFEYKVDWFRKWFELRIKIHGFIRDVQPQREATIDVGHRSAAWPFGLQWTSD